jgi:hypothetical protein
VPGGQTIFPCFIQEWSPQQLQQLSLACSYAVILVLSNRILGLTSKGTSTASPLTEESLALQHPMSDFLDVLAIPLSGLCCRKDGRELLLLIATQQIMNSGVQRVIMAECQHKGPILALDKVVTYADGTVLLHGKWPCRIEHALVLLDDACRHRLAVGGSQCLADVLKLKDRVGLVTEPWAELCEDQCVDLAKTKTDDLDLNRLVDCGCVNVGFAKVEIGGTKDDGSVLQAWLKYEHTDLHSCQG